MLLMDQHEHYLLAAPLAQRTCSSAATALKSQGRNNSSSSSKSRHSSQVLAYMVAITDAQALVRRMRNMRPGPPLHLPAEVQCMDVWQALQGSVQQQRVWTFGQQTPAALPPPPEPAADDATADPDEQQQPTSNAAAAQAANRPRPAAVAGGASAAAADPTAMSVCSVLEPCISSSEPHSIKDGVRFTSCSAGRQHSAAAADGGYVYCWGSNDKGQLGCDTATQQPVVIHVLVSAADAGSSASASGSRPGPSSQTVLSRPSQNPTPGGSAANSAGSSNSHASVVGSRALYNRLDSLKQLNSTVKLPPALLAGLQAQRQRDREAAAEQQEQQELLLQELLRHPELEQQQQLAGKPAAPQPGAAQAAAHLAVLSGIQKAHATTTTGSGSSASSVVSQSLSQQQQQQGEEPRPQALAVYQLHLGQAVRSVACGAHHTLAALASSGLMGWGLNDKGQLGAPAALYQQVNAPMHIHGFDGQRLLCISAGAKHSAAVQEGGVVVTWGHGRYGRLGVGGSPDILPPSVVSGLRGCFVTQVACGTAHTLALTADGRVYACGYNGQGALGTGDDTDRLYPVLVPGLPSCMQVAAAACSIALSSEGQVFVWGGAAGRRLQAGHVAFGTASGASDSGGGTSSSGGGSSSSSSGGGGVVLPSLSGAGGGAAGRSDATHKGCVPWLASVKAVHITCGVDTAAAVSSDGEVLLWGSRQCLPESLMIQSQVLQQTTSNSESVLQTGATAAALSSSGPEQQQQPVATPDTMQAVECTCGGSGRAVQVQLVLDPSGSVSVALTCCPRHSSCPAATVVPHPLVTAPQPPPQQPSLQQQRPQQQFVAAAGDVFNPQQEPVADLACGASHHVVLCQPSEHVPNPDELRAAVLAVLRAYTNSFNSTNTSSLNLLMQEQQQLQYKSEYNYAGSIVGGPAKSTTKSCRPAGYAGSVLSFAGSTGGAKASEARAAALAAGNSPAEAADDAAGNSAAMQRSCSIVQRAASSTGHHVVSFAGGVSVAGDNSGDQQAAGGGSDGAGGGAASVAGGSKAGAMLSSKADRVAGYAASMAAGSTGRGPAASVAGGSQAGGSVWGRPGSAGGAGGPSSDCLSLHGALVLCKEICLLDNITEHLDIINAFELMLHRKRGRLGPLAHTTKPAAAAAAGFGSAGNTIAPAAVGQPAAAGAACLQQEPGEDGHEPEPAVLTVVHVLRPNEPAVPPQPATAAESCEAGAPAGGSRPASPGPGGGELRSSSLDAGELMEMLLLLMKDRHPCYRRQPTVLLKMLAGWHLTRLKGRRADQGPPWLLRQVLQPDVLLALESPATTELLHGIYVHLAGSSANPQDLSMHLSDLRLGLKFAAGFRTQQDMQQEQQRRQQQQRQRGLRQQASSNQRRPALQQSLAGNGLPGLGYQVSTTSSRGHSNEPVPYSLSSVASSNSSRSSKGVGNGSNSSSSSSGSSAKSFLLPLHKVAAFIRTAKLLPRLLDKYIAQLQLKGQEQRVAPNGQRVDGLPVMPCLHMQLQQVLAPVTVGVSQSGGLPRRRAPPAHAGQQQQAGGLAGELSRLAPLKEASFASASGSLSGAGQRSLSPPYQQHQQPQVSTYDSFFEPLPSSQQQYERGAAASSYQRSGSISTRPSMPGAGASAGGGVGGGWSHRLSTDGGAGRSTVRDQRGGGGFRNKAGRSAPVQTLDASMIDAAALNSAELHPVRSTTACLQLIGESQFASAAHSSATRLRSAGAATGSSSGSMSGAANKLLLPLPAAGATVASGGGEDAASWARRSASAGGSSQVSAYGGSSWKQVVDSQQQQGTKVLPKAKAAAKGTYQQQQALLQQQRQAEAASAQLAEEQEAACQDAWTVCMLVELLGSNLVTPPSTAAVKIPLPPVDSATSAAAVGGTPLLSDVLDCNQAVAGVGGVGADSSCCTWDRGYCFSAVDVTSSGSSGAAQQQPPIRSAAAASAGHSGSGAVAAAFSCSGGGVLDLLNHCITYPQFVELLLCLMAARSVSILEPDVKAIRPLAMDEEMQDHARVVMERIQKWRAAQLVPWKQQQQQQNDKTAASPVSANNKQQQALPGAAAGGQEPPSAAVAATLVVVEGQQVVLRVYSAYSSMKLGSSVLGLHREGYLQLLKDAGMVEGSELSVADALSIFKKVAAAVAPSAAPPPPAGMQSTADSIDAVADAASSNSRPSGLGPDNRQSTFMRCVTQQLLQRLQTEDQGSNEGSVGASSNSSSRNSNNSSQDGAVNTGPSAAASINHKPEAVQSGPVLTASHFLQAMVLLSRRCFPRIANGSRAWKLLLERHLQPLADRKRSRYDEMAASLSTPGVVALLTAWGPQLQSLHQTAVDQHGSSQQPHGKQPQGQQPLAQSQQQAPELSLSAFLELLQENGVIPQLLEPCDVQEVLRQLLTTQANQDALFTSLNCSQFSQALSMCGLAAFASRRMQSSHHSHAPEQQLSAFLTLMGLTPLPGAQQQQQQPGVAAGAPTGTASAGAQSDKAGGKTPTGARNIGTLRRQLATDPYIEWWSLQFDPAAESRAHDQLSSLTYMPVMLQEVVQPPSCCPAEVLPLLSAARSAQQSRDPDDALHLLELAEEAWRARLLQQQQQQSAHGLDDEEVGLPPAAVLYLAVSAAGCLLSAGRDEDAVAVLQGCATAGGLLTALHEAGADAAVWQAATGVAKYHCNDMPGAFEHCVRAYVIRCECGALGPHHPDTAAAAHNLGVVLDCLGKCSRGLQLVQEARQVFAAALGPQHTRTLVAARNEQHITHKIIKLPAQPQELMSGGAAGSGSSVAAGASGSNTTGRPAVQGSAGSNSAVVGRRASGGAKTQRTQRGSSGGSGSDADSDSSSDAEDGDQQGGGQKQGGKKKGTAGSGDGGKGQQQRSKSTSSNSRQQQKSPTRGAGSRSLQQVGSMQERLHAVMHARQHNDAAGQLQQRLAADTRDYTDPDHLGAGVFKASSEQQRLYSACLGDIQAHAQGVSSVGYCAQPGRVEMQVPAAASGGVDRSTADKRVQRGKLADATIAAVKKPLSVEQARRLRRRQQQQMKSRGGVGGVADNMLDKLY